MDLGFFFKGFCGRYRNGSRRPRIPQLFVDANIFHYEYVPGDCDTPTVPPARLAQ
jgi:hypothetical protein